MKKFSLLATLVIASLILSACGSSASSSSQTDAEMQNEIVMLLTSMVTETATPLVTATETPLPPTDTPMPTVTEEPTNTVEVKPTEEVETPEFTVEPPGIPTIYTPSGITFEKVTFTPSPDGDDSSDADSEDDADTTPSADDDEEEEVSETADPAFEDPSEGLGDPTYQDTFSDGDNWSLGRDSFMDLRVANGKLVMRGLTTVSGWRITRTSLANGYIELTGAMEDCSGADNYGLYFRVPNAVTASSGYLFGVSCDGKYALRKWDGETMTSLVYWKASDAIKKGNGKTNILGVKLDGYEMELYINGQYIAKIVDDDYDLGSIGIYVAARDSGDLTVLLDDLSVWKK